MTMTQSAKGQANPAINRESFLKQAEFAGQMHAPIVALICRGLAAALSDDSATGKRVLNWGNPPITDALPLRLVAGIYRLYLDGQTPELAPVYAGEMDDIECIASLLNNILQRYDAQLLPWLDSPPQTNEPMRSCAIIAALALLADKGWPKMELLEIGSSAGLNLLMPHYLYQLGEHSIGRKDANIVFQPIWRGAPLPKAQPDIVAIRGSDIHPVNLRDEQAVKRLRAYIWHDHQDRIARFATASAMIKQHDIHVEQSDAATWLKKELAKPQEKGVGRVIFHTIVWQYLNEADKTAIRQYIHDAADKATNDRPLAWLSLETNREAFRHELHVHIWPPLPGMAAGQDQAQAQNQGVHLANAHAHGKWVEWLV